MINSRIERVHLNPRRHARPQMITLILGLMGACASAPPEALDDHATVELSARAVAVACGSDCDVLTVYLRDQLFYSDTLVGDDQTMPAETRTALTELFNEDLGVEVGVTRSLDGFFGRRFSSCGMARRGSWRPEKNGRARYHLSVLTSTPSRCPRAALANSW